MLVTIDWIRKNYIKFNEEYFGGTLPMVKFKVSRSKNAWGFASFLYDYPNSTIIPEAITISNYFDSPEIVKKTTLLHEMIHIEDYTFHPEHFIRNGKRVTGHHYDAHGWWFKEECRRLNAYGWDVEKYVTKEEQSLSSLSVNSKRCLENKKNNALICCVIGTKGAWWFKTDVYKIKRIMKTIKGVNWYTIGRATSVKFYRTDAEVIASRRSCETRLSGWRVTSEALENTLKKYNAKKYKEYKFAA